MSIGLVMIAKDEALAITRCLTSAKPYISTWSICDTGSTDGTQDVIRKAMKGVPGKLYELPFVNFGHNRTEALVAARGTADWLLCLDADVTVEIDDDFEPDPSVEAYMIDFGWPGFVNRLPLLLRGDLPWRSVGPVHEYTSLPDRLYRGKPTDKIRITHHGEFRNTPEKSRWHAGLLEAELARHPDDARSVFYLAETYRRLGDPRAREMYLQRATMTGFIEETWYAQYMAAQMAPEWPERLTGLIEAWEARPHRLEPLYDALRGLNERSQHHSAYALAGAAQRGPSGDTLFVHTWCADWGIAFERSIAAWWIGQRDESRELSLRLLDNPRLPDNIRTAVQRNLALTPEVAA